MDEAVELPFRIDCAKAVCPYLFPRLQAVAISNPDDNRLVIELRDFAKPVSQGDHVNAIIVQGSTTSTLLPAVLAIAEADNEGEE